MSQNNLSVDDMPPAVPLPQRKFIYGFFVLYVLFMLDFAARLGINAVFPLLQKDLGFSDTQMGLLGSAVLVGMSVFVLPVSFMADKGSKKTAVALMAGVWGMGSLITGVLSGFTALLCGRFLVGIGNAAFAPVSVSILTSWIRRSRWGTSVGIYNSAMSLGLALGTVLTGLLAAQYGWRVPVLILGGLTLLFMLLACTLPPSSPAGPKAAVSLREAAVATLKNRALLCISLAAGLGNLVTSGFLAWIPMYLVRDLGWSVATVGATLGPIYLASGVLMMPLSGLLADKLGARDRRSRAWLGAFCLPLIVILYFFGFERGIFPCIAIGMLLFSLPLTGMHIATQELVPARYRASSYGIYVIFIQGLGLLGPVLGGIFSQWWGVKNALVGMQAFLLLEALLLILAGMFYLKDYTVACQRDAICTPD